MQSFEYQRPETGDAAIGMIDKPTARYLGGGTNLIDLMKDNVMSADRVVDVSRLPNTAIEATANDGVKIGAAAKNTTTANHDLIRTKFPLISQAILAAATMQIRNMATNGGNLLQRTRCVYFYERSTPCNKREPGTGCSAVEGLNRMHAIFGASEQCVATHPSDFCVALAAHDAIVHVRGPQGARTIPFDEFHRLPGDHPEIDTNLKQGELIEALEIPPSPFGDRVNYLKIRDRSSYAFALVSVAAALELDGNAIKTARVALGGVAHKPWRARKIEAALVGKPATDDSFKQAVELELADAKPLSHNAYKVPMLRHAIARALNRASGVA